MAEGRRAALAHSRVCVVAGAWTERCGGAGEERPNLPGKEVHWEVHGELLLLLFYFFLQIERFIERVP